MSNKRMLVLHSTMCPLIMLKQHNVYLLIIRSWNQCETIVKDV